MRMARENFLWGAPRIHGELLMLGFMRLAGYRLALHAFAKQAANTIVADLSSQSNHCVRPVFRGAV